MTHITMIIHFSPVFHFYTPWKRQKIKGFLIFSGGIEMEIGLKWVNVMQVHASVNTLTL